MNDLENTIEAYRLMGQRWLNGEIEVEEWQMGDKHIKLNPKQIEYINAKERFTLLSGGFASGKTTAFLMKLILLSLWFPGNRILLGRRTRSELERVTLPDFFDICPEGWAEYRVGPGTITFFNGSEIILFGLDALQAGNGQDIKKAEQSIKSLNLGAVFIDQLEEIEERVFEALDGRLRRNVGFNQMSMTTNPANFWAYDYFLANPRPATRLIQTSMMDNKASLPEAFIASQLSKPKNYVRRYVYGEWTPDIMTDSSVFAEDYIRDQAFYIHSPKREFNGIKIWQEPRKDETYQIGVDPSEGAQDPCGIQVICRETGEQVASYSGFLPVSEISDKAILLAGLYTVTKKPLIVPEANASGVAVIEYLKQKYGMIYEREVFSYREKKNMKKLGFNTNHSTKKLLIENFIELLQKKFVKIRDAATLEEMKVFIWANEARKKGAGAQDGFHDDRLMSLMLAYWNVSAGTKREKELMDRLNEKSLNKKIVYQYK